VSKQIRLEAVGSTVVVADLGLTLRLNEVAWVSREEMQASECLRALVSLGKVRVSSGARSLVSKEPPKRRLPTAVKRSRPNGRGNTPVRNETPAPKALTHQEAQAMADRAAQKAASETLAAASAQFKSILEGLATPSTEGIEGAIERAVSQALAGASVKTATPQASNAPTSEIEDLIAGGPEEPLFIPSGIVKDTSESLSLKSDSSRGAGLDSAADALKALRKGKGTKS
jgi:hypothetical protein